MTREEMDFPKTWEEYEEHYGFNDSEEVYTNGSRLIPSFRVKQWLDHLEQEPCPNAINRTDMLDAIGHGTTYTSEDLQKIIKALSPVNPQPCEDAISREMALKECHDIVFDGERYRVIQEETLLGLPSVTPQPKTGHWMHTTNALGDGIHVCSCCGKLIKQGYLNFCANCGCRMRSTGK